MRRAHFATRVIHVGDDAHRHPTGEPRTKMRPKGGRSRNAAYTAVKTLGELLITVGLVVLLFVFYELYVTNWMTERKQGEAAAELEDQWAETPQPPSNLIDGKAFARIRIPTFGKDYNFTIQEGVDAETLKIGPGHYKGTAMPGERGNFAVAGHRIGWGAPFYDLDLLNSCDAVIIETGSSYLVYRVLPMKGEVRDWASGKGQDAKCVDVRPLGDRNGAYDATFGRVIVTPDRIDAVSPVPYKPKNVLPRSAQASLLTLTTCHPRLSNRQRLIIHAMLTAEYPKERSTGYVKFLRQIGEV